MNRNIIRIKVTQKEKEENVEIKEIGANSYDEAKEALITTMSKERKELLLKELTETIKKLSNLEKDIDREYKFKEVD